MSTARVHFLKEIDPYFNSSQLSFVPLDRVEEKSALLRRVLDSPESRDGRGRVSRPSNKEEEARRGAVKSRERIVKLGNFLLLCSRGSQISFLQCRHISLGHIFGASPLYKPFLALTSHTYTQRLSTIYEIAWWKFMRSYCVV